MKFLFVSCYSSNFPFTIKFTLCVLKSSLLIDAGINTFVVHARKALLNMKPRANRIESIAPLR
jgi:hypothetical protein